MYTIAHRVLKNTEAILRTICWHIGEGSCEHGPATREADSLASDLMKEAKSLLRKTALGVAVAFRKKSSALSLTPADWLDMGETLGILNNWLLTCSCAAACNLHTVVALGETTQVVCTLMAGSTTGSMLVFPSQSPVMLESNSIPPVQDTESLASGTTSSSASSSDVPTRIAPPLPAAQEDQSPLTQSVNIPWVQRKVLVAK